MYRHVNKYRIASARASWWDYGSNAAYFITICTQNRRHFFGEIINHEMMLTALGQHAQSCWNEIPDHFPFVQLGAFVVMPNHIHGIIIIDKTDDQTQKQTGPQSIMGTPHVQTQNFASLQNEPPSTPLQTQNIASLQNEQPSTPIQTQNIASLQNEPPSIPLQTQNIASLQNEPPSTPLQTQNIASLHAMPTINKYGPQSQNLASIVRGYKIGVTKLSKIINPNFKWHPRFHDHIIRNDTEYQRINDYIENNPVKWTIDNFFKQKRNL